MDKNKITEESTFKDIPLYRFSVEHAVEAGELPEYRESYRANLKCKQAIAESIGSHYADNRLDTESIYADVTEKFSKERVAHVLAVTVRNLNSDGRISEENKKWAKTVPTINDKDSWGQDRTRILVISSAHIGLVDLFVTRFRNKLAREAELPQKKPSVLNKLRSAAEKNAVGHTTGSKSIARESEL